MKALQTSWHVSVANDGEGVTDDALTFLRRLIDAQKQMHRAFACANADDIGTAATEIEAILVDGRNIKTSRLLPDQAKARMEARVLVETVLEWQQQNRELGRHSIRILRQLCGFQANPSYGASGQYDESVLDSRVGICV